MLKKSMQLYSNCSYLKPQSLIKIGSCGERFFVAALIENSVEKVRAASQKGIDHLLLLLEAELLAQEGLKIRADELYPYSPSPLESGRDLEFILDKCITTISMVGPHIVLHSISTRLPHPNAPVSQYELHEFGYSLLSVFTAVIGKVSFKPEVEKSLISKERIKEFFAL